MLQVFEQVEEVDLSVARDGERFEVPPDARGVVVLRRDAPCRIETPQREHRYDAARNTFIGVAEGFGADSVLFLHNEPGAPGDVLVLGFYRGRRVSQGVDAFSPNLRVPAPVVLLSSAGVTLPDLTEIVVASGIPVGAFDEVTWANIGGVTGGGAFTNAHLHIELFDAAGASLGTTTIGPFDNTGWPRAITASDPEMHTAELRVEDQLTHGDPDLVFDELRLIGVYTS